MSRIGLLGVFLLLSAGCVIMDSTLTLEHTPAMDLVATKSYKVFLASVSDLRTDTGRIGCKRSGIGSESASLYLDVGLTDWFGGVMNDELRRSGLTLAGSDNPEAFRVEIELIDFFIEPTTSFMGSWNVFAMVNAEVIVRFPDGRAYARRFASQANDTSVMPTDGIYEEVMQTAVTRWISEVVPVVIRLLELNGNIQARTGWRAAG